MATFMIGKKLAFLNTCGIPYGVICIEGRDPIYITSLKEGSDTLKREIEGNDIDADEAMMLEQQMTAANLPTDSTALYAAVAAFELPTAEGFLPSIRFEACACKPDGEKHGYVTWTDDGMRTGLPVFDLFNGFTQCEANVRTDAFHPLDAINVFQGMVAAGLPEKASPDAELSLDIFTLLFGRR